MANLCNQKQCTGCQACYNACNHDAIRMVENERGFTYPEIDTNKCIECGLCSARCPELNPVSYHSTPKTVYACWIKDAVNRNYSTSGGMGYLFSKKIVENGGVFCGCRWNINHAEHVCCEDIDELHQFQGSKYTYSNIGYSYKRIKEFLNQNRKVLFIGTSCQVAALRRFLGKDYDNLLLVDIICHGLPSPKLLRDRISDIEKQNNSKVCDLRFRHKLRDQYDTCMQYTLTNGEKVQCSEYKDFFFRGFDWNFFLRENCFSCSYASMERVSDVTISDFWGYMPKHWKFISFRKGTSAVLLNTEKGKSFFDSISNEIIIDVRDSKEIKSSQQNLNSPQVKPDRYEDFWRDYEEGVKAEELQARYFPPIQAPKWGLMQKTKLFVKLFLYSLNLDYRKFK